MEYISLHKKVTLSRIIQGFWRLHTWNFTAQQLAEFMNACIDRGVTTFDTAEIYGDYETENLIGAALAYDPTLRSRIQIVTKTGINKVSTKYTYQMGHYDTRYEKIIASCKASIAKMNCGYIDVYLIHREDKLINHKEVARAFHDLQEEGLILSAGVSNFDPHKLRALYHHSKGQLVTNQIEWNPLVFEHIDSGMLDYLQEIEVHPMVWSPLAGGSIFVSDDPSCVKLRTVLQQIAEKKNVDLDTIVYAWILKHPVKAMPISGSQKLERLDHAIQALDIELTNEEWYMIYNASGIARIR